MSFSTHIDRKWTYVISVFFVSLLAFALPSTSNALPGKRVAVNTETDEAFLAFPRIWSTSPAGCFSTFSQPFYPCLRVKRPKAIWISGYFSDGVGWEFGDGQLPGWTIRCGKGRSTGTKQQLRRDGLKAGQYWVNRKTIQLPLPIRNPDWCEVNVEAESPDYVPGFDLWWDNSTVVDSEVQIRAISRRR